MAAALKGPFSTDGEPVLAVERISAYPITMEEGAREETPRSVWQWPHAPPHDGGWRGSLMVTAGTLHKRRLFQQPPELDFLTQNMLTISQEAGWSLHAWAVFANHYHWVGNPLPDAEPLKAWIRDLHSRTARFINQQQQQAGRPVWYNYWDSPLTFQRSYLARLAYVHRNAVHHGLVMVPETYRWCSAGWPGGERRPSWVNTLESFPIDRVKVYDPF